MREALFVVASPDAMVFMLLRAHYERASFHPRQEVSNRVAQSLDRDGRNCYHTSMKIVSGKVIEGRIVVEGEPLEEGCTVTVLAPEQDETFVLDSEAEAALLAAMGEADRGETIAGGELLNRLS